MNDKPQKDTGKQIGDIVRSALHSGDLSRLKDIGPVVEGAVKEIPIVKAQGQNAAGGTGQNTTQKPAHPAASPGRAPAGAYHGGAARPAWQGSAPPAKHVSTSSGLVPIVLGAVGLVGFGLAAVALGFLALIPGMAPTFGAGAVALFVSFLLCGGVMVYGFGRRRRAKRVLAYYALLAEKPVRTFEEISAATGWPAAKIKKDIRRAMAGRLMPDVRMDKAETCIMQGEDAYQQYMAMENARMQREKEVAERDKRLADPATAELEKFRQEGKTTLEKIRQANNAIAGEEVSEKLATLGETTAKIFAYVEKNPQKLPDTRRFMSYYLPTTLKLVDKYRQYEEMQVRSEAVQAARRDIEAALDTINTAFRNLLESLYQEDTLDVTTDIQALKTVLEQEGLTGNKFEISPEMGAMPENGREPW